MLNNSVLLSLFIIYYLFSANAILLDTLPIWFFCNFLIWFHSFKSTGSSTNMHDFVSLELDECELETHNCHAKASCSNTDGSYTCTCDDGYTGDGFTCTGIQILPVTKDCIRSKSSILTSMKFSHSWTPKVTFHMSLIFLVW